MLLGPYHAYVKETEVNILEKSGESSHSRIFTLLLESPASSHKTLLTSLGRRMKFYFILPFPWIWIQISFPKGGDVMGRSKVASFGSGGELSLNSICQTKSKWDIHVVIVASLHSASLPFYKYALVGRKWRQDMIVNDVTH